MVGTRYKYKVLASSSIITTSSNSTRKLGTISRKRKLKWWFTPAHRTTKGRKPSHGSISSSKRILLARSSDTLENESLRSRVQRSSFWWMIDSLLAMVVVVEYNGGALLRSTCQLIATTAYSCSYTENGVPGTLLFYYYQVIFCQPN